MNTNKVAALDTRVSENYLDIEIQYLSEVTMVTQLRSEVR